MKRRKVLLVGWDAADWEICLPLVEAGKMPALAKLMEEGTWGNLTTIQPAYSPMLWTSIATGKRPFKHGIHGFSEVDPGTGLVRPITNLSRSCRAIWNILQLHGYRSAVTGWWPSHPAEPIDGVMVSDRFHVAPASAGMPWPVPTGAVHPPEMAAALKELRIHPHHLDESHLLPFIPAAAKIDQRKDDRLEKLARILAECSTVHATATAAMGSTSWDFAAVYYDALDHFCHGFMKYHPPLKNGVDPLDYEIYRHVVEGAYRYHDMMLATLLRIAGEETTVMLVSDHGFQSGGSRPDTLPLEPAGPATEHRRYGIFVARGPGIRRGHRIHGAGLLDVCPTLLTLFGLPVGADMDGRALAEIWDAPPAIRSIPSWEEIKGDDGSHPAGLSIDSGDAGEGIRQLVALGYIAPPGDDAILAAEITNQELKYNLALSYMDAGRYGDAELLLEPLHVKHPEEHRFGLHLAACYHAIGREGKITGLSRRLVRAQLRKEREHGAVLDRDALRHFLAFAAFSEKRFGQVLQAIGRMSPAYRERAETRNMLAEVQLRLRRWQDAEWNFLTVIAADQENANAWCGVARARLGMRRYPAAAEAAISSISLVFGRPLAHFLLGMALFRNGEMERARKAFELATHLNPSYAAAYRMLSEIHTRHGGDVAMGAACNQMARQARQRLREAREREISPGKPPAERAGAPAELDKFPDSLAGIPRDRIITVVSGLPRSGTSMMMQMLAAGGLTVFADNGRIADASNPHGYFEHEAVKLLHRDASWLPDARGKVVKIVAPLLPFLVESDREGKPLHYRVIFMTRPLEDVMASRSRMLEESPSASGEQAARTQENLARHFLRTRQISALEIDYTRVLKETDRMVGELRDFLGIDLDAFRMTQAIKPPAKG
ncbi:alkaline phosphatase family protein [Luteolibacter yonseiensis]|uniref:Alkaline phosphatase family protein n=1 Tax=Luteolibacter yonseiensis TaxID=1144680 RepID=A0A934R103_9BACT|nr:alkaline phosphatase family protein [Luteolibacter yonseiensis]MBK1814351.1 alkaline phosphatase family protein [Luteolibacter yonseiensis]